MSNVLKGDFKQKVPKKSLTELCEEIASAINFEGHPYPIPWPWVYRSIEPEAGTKLILEESPDMSLREVSHVKLANDIVAWMRLQQVPEWFMTFRKAKEAVEYWQSIVAPIDQASIKAIRWQDEPGYTWRRLPWNYGSGSTPTWDDLLSRMTNVPAFKAWVGSLFFDQSSISQYIWMHGLGNDGKGSINRFFRGVFGHTYRSKHPPKNHDDKFWSYNLIGARLVVFPDCNDRRFVASGFFKAMTGGDPIAVEAKGRMPFTATLNCKFLVMSNEEPNISSERADMRRIIYCEFADKGIYDPYFEKRLYDEGGAFLTECIELYKAACPHHESIAVEDDQILAIVATNEEEFTTFFARNFEVSTNDYVMPGLMQSVITSRWHERWQQSEFRSWLKRTHGVRKKSIRVGDTVFDGYRGIKHRTHANF